MTWKDVHEFVLSELDTDDKDRHRTLGNYLHLLYRVVGQTSSLRDLEARSDLSEEKVLEPYRSSLAVLRKRLGSYVEALSKEKDEDPKKGG